MLPRMVRKYDYDLKLKVVRYAEKYSNYKASKQFNISQANIKRWRRVLGPIAFGQSLTERSLPASGSSLTTRSRQAKSTFEKVMIREFAYDNNTNDSLGN